MSNGYIAQLKQSLKDYVLSLLQENCELYGSDIGNNPLIQRYIDDMGGYDAVKHKISTISDSLIRIKSLLLLQYPELDKREKHKPKIKNVA